MIKYESVFNFKIKDLPFYLDVKRKGGSIYQVGGSVRDKFLDLPSKDIDLIITGIKLNNLIPILGKYGTPNLVGESFGVIKWIEFGTTEELDIALPRTERVLGDSGDHKNFEIITDESLPIEHDLKRRDLRFNSIALDDNGNLIDPFDGMRDLKNKLIRVTDERSFQDDALRMLRAIQFTARFRGFKLHLDTLRMIRNNKSKIKSVSKERIIEELNKIVSKGNPKIGAMLLVQTGLGEEIFGIKLKINISDFDKCKTLGEFLYLLLKKTKTTQYLEQFLKNWWSNIPINILKEVKALEYLNINLDSNNLRYHLSRAISIFDIRDSKIIDRYYIREVPKMGTIFPLGLSDLDITGSDIIKLGIKGRKVGEILDDCLKVVYLNKVKNNNISLYKYIVSRYIF